jgi:hypothetical protein
MAHLSLKAGQYTITVRLASPNDPEWHLFKPEKSTKYRTEQSELFGMFDYARLSLLIAPWVSVDRRRSVVYHELGHFLVWSLGLDSSEGHANWVGLMLESGRAYDKELAPLFKKGFK